MLPVERLRLSMDIVGDHDLGVAIWLQRAMVAAGKDLADGGVRVELLPSHEHTAGCSWCLASVADPSYHAERLTGDGGPSAG
jgi:hypothetical protein